MPRDRRELRALEGCTVRSTSGESDAVPPTQGDDEMPNKLYPIEARDPDFHAEVLAAFSNLQLETVACELCGEYHPPEIHLRPLTPFNPSEPEEA